MLIDDYNKIKNALMTIDITDWKTKRELLEQLRINGIKISDRKWYLFLEKHNLRYCDGLEKEFIAHSKRKGYKLTTNFELIRESWRDFEKTAKNLLWKASRYKKAYAEHKNISMEELEGLYKE